MAELAPLLRQLYLDCEAAIHCIDKPKVQDSGESPKLLGLDYLFLKLAIVARDLYLCNRTHLRATLDSKDAEIRTIILEARKACESVSSDAVILPVNKSLYKEVDVQARMLQRHLLQARLVAATILVVKTNG